MGIEIWALSPSDEDVLVAMQEFANILASGSPYASTIPAIEPNKASVVLFVKVGEDALLLGGDLEQNSKPQSGWNAVLQSPFRSTVASVFKIPHHGSRGAFSQAIWDHAISNEAISVVTPYSRSGLPRPDDIELLKLQRRQIYATAVPRTAQILRSRELELAMERNKPRKIEAVQLAPQNGQVRLRKRLGAPWEVRLTGSAMRIA